jgi:hypothetical protein
MIALFALQLRWGFERYRLFSTLDDLSLAGGALRHL